MSKRRTRKLRRLAKARIRTGKKIVVHKSKSGRTGHAMHKKLKGMRVNLTIKTIQEGE